MDNRTISGNNLCTAGLRALQKRLPGGWTAQLDRGSPANNRVPDAHFRITSPGRSSARLAVETKSHLEPRGVRDILERRTPQGLLLIAPYLSGAVRTRLREAAVSFLDLTGNVFLQLDKPGLFIETHGADSNPQQPSRSRSLRGPKAGRVVRALVEAKEPPGVREVAALTGVDAGYVSRLLRLLDHDALIERKGRGQVVSVDWENLLRRWAEEAPLSSRGTRRSCFQPRGLIEFQSRLKQLPQRYAITASLAGARLAPVAPPRLATVYVADIERAIAELDLRVVDAATNVLLIEPRDSSVFDGSNADDGLWFVAPSQAAADLLTSPGRGPEEAESLLLWMRQNENAWRG